MTITHSFHSAITDGLDTTLVRPSGWNADHVMSGTSLQVIYNNAGSLAGMSGTTWTDAQRSLVVGSVGGLGYTLTAPASTSNILQLGGPDVGSPVAQALHVQSVVAGTTSTAGGDWTFQGSLSTGNAAAGNLNFATGWKGEPSSTSLTVTISNAAGVQPPSVVQCTSGQSNGLIPGQAIQFTTTGTLPAPLQTGTTYYWLGFYDGTHPAGIIDIAGASNIATVPGGTPILTTNAGSGTHTLIVPNATSVNGPLVINAATALAPLPSGNVPTLQIGPASITGSQNTPALSLTRTDSSNFFGNADAGIQMNMWRNGGAAGEKNSYINVYHNGLPYLSLRRPGSDSDFMVGGVAGVIGTGGCFELQVYTSAFKIGVGAQTTNNGVPIVYCLPSTQIYGKSDGTGGIAQYGYIGFTSSTQADGNTSAVTNPDVMFFREAAGIFAQRDGFTGTNAQSLHVFNTADTINVGAPTNGEWGVFDWKLTANLLTMGTKAAGTGTVRDFAIVKGANTFFTSATTVVGSLPAAGTVGRRHTVTDANATFTAGIGAVVAGGGSNKVPVFDDGTNWRIG